MKMPDCELLATCPFFNDKTQDMSEMAETLKEHYCKGLVRQIYGFQGIRKRSEDSKKHSRTGFVK